MKDLKKRNEEEGVDHDHEINVRGLSKEEMLEKSRKLRAVQPIYEEKAPIALDEMIAEQNVDMVWTNESQESAKKIMEDPRFGNSKLLSMECFETLCTARLRHSNENAAELFRANGLAEGPWNGPMTGFDYPHPDGTVESKLYFGRHGEDHLLHDEVTERLYAQVAEEKKK